MAGSVRLTLRRRLTHVDNAEVRESSRESHGTAAAISPSMRTFIASISVASTAAIELAIASLLEELAVISPDSHHARARRLQLIALETELAHRATR